ncbi:MAG: hypothetical protein RBT25_04785 [Lentisphaeria bacterium]|nr:hypothetical protein [Lentisphaeria bacterium]
MESKGDDDVVCQRRRFLFWNAVQKRADMVAMYKSIMGDLKDLGKELKKEMKK